MLNRSSTCLLGKKRRFEPATLNGSSNTLTGKVRLFSDLSYAPGIFLCKLI